MNFPLFLPINFSLKKHPILYLFLGVCLLSVIFSIVLNEYIITDEVFYNTYIENLNIERIKNLSKLIEKINWIYYSLTPILYFFKFLIIAAILPIGDLLFEYHIGFKKLFWVAIISETVFLLQEFLKIIWFTFFEHPETIRDIGNFDVLSIYSLVNNQELYSWLIYPFKTANLFELGYWLIMALAIKSVSKINYDNALKLVLSTYVPILFVWIVFIMYLSI